MATVYKINKGINQPLEFKGLVAQYVVYLALGLLTLLISFTVLYLVGVPTLLCLFLVVMGGIALFIIVYRMSHKYGQHGYMKKRAHRKLPTKIHCTTRKVFLIENRINHGN